MFQNTQPAALSGQIAVKILSFMAANKELTTTLKVRLYCAKHNPKENQYRQHPQDYIDSLTFVVTDALSRCSEEVRKSVVGISFDTTASTPAIVDATVITISGSYISKLIEL